MRIRGGDFHQHRRTQRELCPDMVGKHVEQRGNECRRIIDRRPDLGNLRVVLAQHADLVGIGRRPIGAQARYV